MELGILVGIDARPYGADPTSMVEALKLADSMARALAKKRLT